MKKIINLLLCVCMVTSVITVTGFANTQESAQRFVRNMTDVAAGATESVLGSGTQKPLLIEKGMIIGQRMIIPNANFGNITKISIRCPSYSNNIGNLTFKVYKWDESYKKSVAGKPLVTKEFENFSDNAYLEITANSFLPSDVLLTIENSTDSSSEKVGVWTLPKRASSKQYMFNNGTEVDSSLSGSFFYFIPSGSDSQDAPKKDAYSKIQMGEADSMSGCTKTQIQYEGESISAIKAVPKSFALYNNVDFGTASPKGVEMLVQNSGVNGGSVQLQVILDNLFSGDIIAQLDMDYHEVGTVYEKISCDITHNVTGVHDVYVTFAHQDSYCPMIMQFTKDAPVESYYAKRLREFNENKNFEITDMYSDTWTGTDMLGRKFIDLGEAGEFNPDKQVGMFYWTWHAHPSKVNRSGWSNNQQVLDDYDGDIADIYNNYNYPGWGSPGFWNESIYGYYHGMDDWVMRKQLELLSAAGVDGLFTDSTNGAKIFQGGHLLLCSVMHKMHLEGIETPKLSFIFPFNDGENTLQDIENVYENIYEPGLYSDCWYYWDGKPVLMSHHDLLEKETGFADVDAQRKKMADFFTFRPGQPTYFDGPKRDDHWPWLEVYPQHAFGKSDKYGCECVSVGVAQNANDNGLNAMNAKNVYGRSYTYHDRFSKYSDTSIYYGYNIAEQWERAYELNPEFVFIDGWNEWTAGHYDSWGKDGTKGAYPDTFADEYSRDIEPTKGKLKDVYYCQMVNNIRRFKGVRKAPEASEEKTVDLEAGFAQWDDVKPDFIGYKGGVENRDAVSSVDNPKRYINTSGRNDIILSKVARDDNNVYFYVKTAEKITSYVDSGWMHLFINTDRSYKTGWEGFDFVINRVAPKASKAVLEKSVGDWLWEKAAEVDYKVEGNEMMICVPKKALGISGAVDIEFKWNDNGTDDGDIMDFYVNGDTAPVGRFTYHYFESAASAKKITDEPVVPTLSAKDILSRSVIMRVDNPLAFASGERTLIDKTNNQVVPKIINDKTMVPVRFLSEALGAKVTWDEATETAMIMFSDRRIRVTVGSPTLMVEKEKRTLQTPAMEENGRILVPLRDITEAGGLACLWYEPGVIVLGGKKDKLAASENIIYPYLMRIFD